MNTMSGPNNKLTCRNNLLRLLIMFVMCVIATGSFAQTLGIKAGLNLSNMLVKSEYLPHYYEVVDSRMHPGFNAGVTVEFPIKNAFYIDVGLLLSTMGYKISQRDWRAPVSLVENRVTTNLIYLDIPFQAKAYLNGGVAKIYVAFGPYIGIGLGGKEKWYYHYYGNSISSSGNPFSDLGRLDFGLTAGISVVMNSCQIDFSYGYGLVNISKGNDFILKNRVLGISLSYKFGGN